MKKVYFLLVVGVLLLTVCGIALAAPDAAGNISNQGAGISAEHVITAVVDPYAEITWGDLSIPTLSGKADESAIGALGFNVAANCAVDITLTTPQMKTDLSVEAGHAETDTDTISTQYAIKPGKPNVNAPQASEYSTNTINKYMSALDQESRDFTLYYKVFSGNSITSQHAGEYEATITVNVMAQAY